MTHWKRFIPIPFILSVWVLQGCKTTPMVIPDFNLEGERNVVHSVEKNVSLEVATILDAADSGSAKAPDLSEWPVITSSASRISAETDRLEGLGGSLEIKDLMIAELSLSARTLEKDKEELARELQDARDSDLAKSFGLMILAGSTAIAAGIALAIFVSPKIGISVGLLGLCWVAIGRFLAQWAWLMDVALLVVLVGGVLYLLIRYKKIFFDFATSVRDALDGDEDRKKAIAEKSGSATNKEADKAMHTK